MRNHGNPPAGKITAIAALLALICLLFLPSLALRKATFGTVPLGPPGLDSSHRALTALATTMAVNWHRLGPLATGFQLQLTAPTPENRVPAYYPSYPSGFIVPPYLASKLTGKWPDMRLLMALSLAWQLALACVIALLAFSQLGAAGFAPVPAAGVALVSAALALYLPGSLLFFQHVWWPELVGLLPFALVVLLEQDRKWPKVQLALLFIGACTDWLHFPLAATLLFKRVYSGEWKGPRGLKDCAGIVSAATLGLVFYICTGGQFGEFLRVIVKKALVRAGIGGEGEASWLVNTTTFWRIHARDQIGELGIALLALLAGGLIAALLARRKTRLTYILLLAVAPVLLHTVILSQHHNAHTYQGLKLIFPLALLPMFAAELFSHAGLRRKWQAALLGGALGLGFLAYAYPRFPALYAQNQSISAEAYAMAKLIGAQAKVTDLVFSPSFSIESNSPKAGEAEKHNFALAISQKPVHQARNIEEVREAIERPSRELPGVKWWPEAMGVMVVGRVRDEPAYSYWKKFAPPTEEDCGGEACFIVRFPPGDKAVFRAAR